MKGFVFGVLLAVFVCGSQGISLPKWGRCKNLPVTQNFSLPSYMDSWFTQQGMNIDSVQGGAGRCSSAHYTLDAVDGIVSVFNKMINLKTNKWQNISGTAVPKNATADEGRFVVTFNLPIWNNWSRKTDAPYNVLATDYESYAVVYSCVNIFYFFHYEFAWLLSRDQVLTGKAETNFYSNTNAVLKANNIDSTKFKTVAQTDCFTVVY